MPTAAKSVWVRIGRDEERISLSIRGEGVGLPPGFDVAKSNGLGMSIVNGLVEQLGATFSVKRRDPGTEFTLVLPKGLRARNYRKFTPDKTLG
jgi:two-component sensor histidine kinase